MGNGPSVSKALTFSAKGIVKSVSEALSVTLFTMSCNVATQAGAAADRIKSR